MKCCRTLGLCLLLTTTERISANQLGSPVPIPPDQPQTTDVPFPKIGDRTSDGFLVKCYWIGTYKCVEKFEGQGVTDLFGQALSPVNGKQTTTASIIITEEIDNSGQRRAVVRDGDWASNFTGLQYWFKNGRKVGAGPGGSGGGRIPTSGEGAPTVSVIYENGISFGWTESDALAFDSKYIPLKLVTGGPSPLGVGPAGRQHLELDTKEKTERRKVNVMVMGMTVIGEPVKAGGHTVIRQEWGDPGSNFYAQWTMTRACQYAVLKLVTPRGNPRTKPRDSGDGQNEFTYDASKPGRLVINFKAKLIPSIPGLAMKMAPRVRFRIDEIGKTLPEWDRPNPDGQASVAGNALVAKLTVIGLPARNADLGKKRVDLLLDGQLVESSDVEVFFNKDAENHPGTVQGPNWFYYWQEGGVCGIDRRTEYDPQSEFGKSGYLTQTVYLGSMAAGTNDGPERYTSGSGYGSVTVTGRGKGIKCVAETVEHEKHHLANFNAFHAAIVATPPVDPDKDGIPNANEPALDGMRSNTANPDTFRMGGDYSGYGDDEIRCRKKELQLTIPYFTERDWANPGCQSKNRFGPD